MLIKLPSVNQEEEEAAVDEVRLPASSLNALDLCVQADTEAAETTAEAASVVVEATAADTAEAGTMEVVVDIRAERAAGDRAVASLLIREATLEVVVSDQSEIAMRV